MLAVARVGTNAGEAMGIGYFNNLHDGAIAVGHNTAGECRV